MQNKKTKQDFLNVLESKWRLFPAQVYFLKGKELENYLLQQGFKTVRDLLAHIIGLWEQAIKDIETLQSNPKYTGEINSNELNAESVKKYKDFNDKQIQDKYNEVLNQYRIFIADLPDDVFTNPKVQEWIYSSEIEHYNEHKILEEKESSETSKLDEMLEEEKFRRIELMADFQNYKKRIEAEKATWAAVTNLSLIQDLVEIYDDLEFTQTDTGLTLDGAKTAIKSAQDKIMSASSKAGVQKVEVKVGDEFNKDFMEALSTVPVSEDEKKNKVVAVISSGLKYVNNGLVVKPAKVIVGK